MERKQPPPSLPEDVLIELAPTTLRQTILTLASAQQPGNRQGVTIGAIMDAVLHGATLGTGATGWARYLLLKQAVAEAVDQIAGMRYVEGDA